MSGIAANLRLIAKEPQLRSSWHLVQQELLKAAEAIERLEKEREEWRADLLDEHAYNMPVYGLHTQRKALLDLIAFIYREVIKRPELERLFDELRFPEDRLDALPSPDGEKG